MVQELKRKDLADGSKAKAVLVAVVKEEDEEALAVAKCSKCSSLRSSHWTEILEKSFGKNLLEKKCLMKGIIRVTVMQMHPQ